MGRATIESGGEDGLYTISIDTGTDIRDARVAKLESRQASLNTQVSGKESEVAAMESVLVSRNMAVNAAIDAYSVSAQTAEDKALVTAAVAARNGATDALGTMNNALGMLKSDLAGVEITLAALNALDLTKTKLAWCADYTDDASGEVDTIEINGEPPTIIIAPQNSETPSTDAPGYLLNRAVMSGPQAYYNAAILPGWQKFLPTFRTGEITAVDYDEDTANVAMDDAASTAQELNINKLNSLSGVPIEYMDCHAAVFEEGDQVVIKFEGQDWDNPKIIGFKDHPKQCWTAEFYEYHELFVSQVGAPAGVYQTWQLGLIKGDQGEYVRNAYLDAISPDPYPLFPPEITELEFWVHPPGRAWLLLEFNPSIGSGTWRHDASGWYQYTMDGETEIQNDVYDGDGFDVLRGIYTIWFRLYESGSGMWFGASSDLQHYKQGGSPDHITEKFYWECLAGFTEFLIRKSADKSIICHFATDMSNRAVTHAVINNDMTGEYDYPGGGNAFIPGFELNYDSSYEMSDPPP